MSSWFTRPAISSPTRDNLDMLWIDGVWKGYMAGCITIFVIWGIAKLVCG